jgi:hypothetical protein
MFEKISHIGGLTTDKEILFSTPFNYFFPEAARSRLCLLPESNDTVAALRELGRVMADPGDTTAESLDSTIPAIYTYFGQFIDHDITARTDRDTDVSFLGRNEPIAPLILTKWSPHCAMDGVPNSTSTVFSPRDLPSPARGRVGQSHRIHSRKNCTMDNSSSLPLRLAEDATLHVRMIGRRLFPTSAMMKTSISASYSSPF